MEQLNQTKITTPTTSEKSGTSYLRKFMTAKLNLEILQQEKKFSVPTRELINSQL